MCTRRLWLAASLMAAALVVYAAGAQAQRGQRDDGPGKQFQGKGKKGPKKGPFGGAVTVDDVIQRLMSFDSNKDGKITKDELPERMQHLVARGDANKDGALDKGEVKKLATALAQDARAGVPLVGFGGPGGKGGPGGPKGPFAGAGRFGGPGPEAFDLRALDDLNLTDSARDKAEAIVRAHHRKVRKQVEAARSELLSRMKEVLGAQDYKTFEETLARRPKGPPPFPPLPPDASRAAELDNKLDQALRQLEDTRKQLEELRREIKR